MLALQRKRVKNIKDYPKQIVQQGNLILAKIHFQKLHETALKITIPEINNFKRHRMTIKDTLHKSLLSNTH